MDKKKENELREMFREILWNLYGYPKIWASDEWIEADKAIEKVNHQVDLLIEIIKNK